MRVLNQSCRETWKRGHLEMRSGEKNEIPGMASGIN